MDYSKKAQMKIQQMAFMLVAVMIFFSMVAIVYFVIVLSKLSDSAEDLRQEEAKELARQMAGTPELMFSEGTFAQSSAIDFDKAFFLKQHIAYNRGFWNLDYLAIERIYPAPNPAHRECTLSTLATCRYLTIINNTNNLAGTQTAPVAIVRWDNTLGIPGGDYRFELGRIHTLAHDPTK